MSEHPFFQHLKEMTSKTDLPIELMIERNSTPLPDPQIQDLSAKVVVVTGANAGIGFETAKYIAKMKPKKLILACRSVARGEAAKKKIEEETQYTGAEVWELDLSSIASVKDFAKKFNDSGLPIDSLVSNAGINATEWVETSDGYEQTYQVNHIANALLILLLTPSLKRSTSARVEVVASDTHYWPSIPSEDDPTPVRSLLKKPEKYERMAVYPASKLLNVLFAKEYAKRCPHNIWVCSSNPGFTESELGTKDHTGTDTGHRFPNIMAKRTTYDGAKTIIHCAVFPDTNKQNNGAFFSEMKATPPRSSVQGERGDKFAKNVWDDTMEILSKHAQHSEIEEWAWQK